MKKAYREDRFPKPTVPSPSGELRPAAETMLKTKDNVVEDTSKRPSTTWGVHQQDEQS